MIPDTLDDKYEIRREIASGAMGAVYLAYHKTLHRDVAIKVPHKRFSADPSFVERFLREARAMARMDHQNVIRVFDVLVIENIPYIVMEFFPADNIKERLYKNGPFSVEDTVNIGSQIANGLNYAHGMGVIHRDIKPANILIDDNGVGKLVDFGIAAAGGELGLTSTGDVIGTPQYMSPEQARGDHLDTRTDIYSLGILFYQMLTQKTPLDEISTVAMIGKLAYEEQELELVFPPEVPDSLSSLIRSMVFKKRDDRPENIKIVCQKLYDLLPVTHRQNLSTVTTFDRNNEATLIQERQPSQANKKPTVEDVATVIAQPTTPPTSPSEANTVIGESSAILVEKPKKNNSFAIALISGISIAAVAGGVFFYSQQNTSNSTISTSTPVSTPSPKPAQVIADIDKQNEEMEKRIKEAESVAKKREQELLSEINALKSQEKQKLAKEKQQALVLNNLLQNLESKKSLALRSQGSVDNENVRKWAKTRLTDSNKTMSAADKLAKETQSLVSQNLTQKAITSANKAIAKYDQVVKSHKKILQELQSKLNLANQLKQDLSTLNGLIRDVSNAKSKADKNDANHYAKRIYKEAHDLLQSSKKLRDKSEASINQLKLDTARPNLKKSSEKANRALNKFNAASKVAALAIEEQRIRPASKDDINAASLTLQKFKHAFENQNINNLNKMSVESNEKLDFFKQLFSIYKTVEISINDFSINSRHASAVASIERLVKKNGDITIPSSSWKNTTLALDKTSTGWNKLKMR